MKAAAIDIGTNSIHMIIVDLKSSLPYRVIDREKDMIRLGSGSNRAGRLTAEAMRRGVEVLAKYKKLADSHGVEKILACATSAVREASNGGDFLARAARQTGIRARIVPGVEEGRLVFLAVQQQVRLGDQTALILDVGGGSVELVLGNDQEFLGCESLKLGFIRLSETFLRGDPASRSSLREMEEFLESEIKPTVERIRSRGFDLAVGTSGTFQNLAAMAYLRRQGKLPENLNNVRLPAEAFEELSREMSRSTRRQRQGVTGLDSRRTDTIVAGSSLVCTLLKSLKIREVLVSDASLREGIVLDYLLRSRTNLRAIEEIPDLRRRSVLKLARQCAYDREHSHHVARLALSFFEQLRPLHKLEDRYGELLEYAAMLHDIGYHISAYRHHKHAYYLVKNGDLRGFTPEEVEVIANVSRYHRKGVPRRKHRNLVWLPRADRLATKRLSAILRIADGLDRSHYQLVDELRCRPLNGRLIVSLQTNRDVELEIWGARRKARLFEKVFRRELEFRKHAARKRPSTGASGRESLKSRRGKLLDTA